MSRFPRAYRQQLAADDAAKIDRIVRESADEVASHAGVTAGGDSRRLRGIPAIGRGSSGAVAGSDPVRTLLAKERRRGA